MTQKITTKSYVFDGTQEMFDLIRQEIGDWLWCPEKQNRFGECRFKQDGDKFYINDVTHKVYEFETIDYSIPRKTTYTTKRRQNDWFEMEPGDIIYRFGNLSGAKIMKQNYGKSSLERCDAT